MKRVSLRLLLMLMLAACGDPGAAKEAGPVGPPTVYVVNYPLKYFAERIGGADVRVVFPVMQGDPASWKPDGDVIAAFQKADLILLNGAGYAGWVRLASLPESKCVDTSEAFAKDYIRIEGARTHAHGPTGEHAHGGIASTTWLDPAQAVAQAHAIQVALLRRWPEGGFEKRFAALRDDLLEVARRLEAVAPRGPGVASHPVYQYLARRYGMNLKSVHWEPDEAPGADGWAELRAILKEHPARWMLWEGEPLAETARRLEELGVKSVVFDPCGNTPGEGDFLTVMNQNVAALAATE
ncbi:MAG: metal ABC transporter substrate-binding protein [Planctomycetota bacterium]